MAMARTGHRQGGKQNRQGGPSRRSWLVPFAIRAAAASPAARLTKEPPVALQLDFPPFSSYSQKAPIACEAGCIVGASAA